MPQQEIANAHLAGGANQQVGIRQIGCVQPGGDGFFVDAEIPEPSFQTRVLDYGVDRVHQFGASAIVDGHVEPHAAVVRGGVDGILQLVPHLRRKPVQPAHASETDAIA